MASLSPNLFSTFLFQRSSIYYLFVAGQSSAVTAESSNNEYIITQEERGHWMLSLLHSWITVTAAFYLLYHRKKNSNDGLRRKHSQSGNNEICLQFSIH